MMLDDDVGRCCLTKNRSENNAAGDEAAADDEADDEAANDDAAADNAANDDAGQLKVQVAYLSGLSAVYQRLSICCCIHPG